MAISRTIAFLFINFSFSSYAYCLSNVDVSLTSGAYRDVKDELHLPTFTTLRYSGKYSGMHDRNIETQLDLILANDLKQLQTNQQKWKAMSSQASVSVPLTSGDEEPYYRRSRVQIGRQQLILPFEFSLLDGMILPYYWSEKSALRLIVGRYYPTDLDSEEGLTLSAVELSDSLGKRTLVKWGYSNKPAPVRNVENDQNTWFSIYADGSEGILPWSPALLSKVDFGTAATSQWKFLQSHSELQLHPFDGLFISTAYSHRNPRRVTKDENLFLYRMIAYSPQESWNTGFRWAWNEMLELQVEGRQFYYTPYSEAVLRQNSQLQTRSNGFQENISLLIHSGVHEFRLPNYTHIRSWGGEFWDVGADWSYSPSLRWMFQQRLAAAYFEKVNHLTGTGYFFRSTLQWTRFDLGFSQLGPSWSETITINLMLEEFSMSLMPINVPINVFFCLLPWDLFRGILFRWILIRRTLFQRILFQRILFQRILFQRILFPLVLSPWILFSAVNVSAGPSVGYGAGPYAGSGAKPVALNGPLSKLFRHPAHEFIFKSNSIQCTDCHSFAVKSLQQDPLGTPISGFFLKPGSKSCHECHMQVDRFPAPTQCTLCHLKASEVAPFSHKLNWKSRHGLMAQVDPDSCRQCHKESTCGDCHTARNSLRSSVHRQNFKWTHSIEARARPESCATCHSTVNTCLNCHTKGGI